MLGKKGIEVLYLYVQHGDSYSTFLFSLSKGIVSNVPLLGTEHASLAQQKSIVSLYFCEII